MKIYFICFHITMEETSTLGILEQELNALKHRKYELEHRLQQDSEELQVLQNARDSLCTIHEIALQRVRDAINTLTPCTEVPLLQELQEVMELRYTHETTENVEAITQAKAKQLATREDYQCICTNLTMKLKDVSDQKKKITDEYRLKCLAEFKEQAPELLSKVCEENLEKLEKLATALESANKECIDTSGGWSAIQDACYAIDSCCKKRQVNYYDIKCIERLYKL
jgi:hypothetical protein